MDLSPVEIKVNVEGDVPAALAALGGTHGAMTTRRIWFAEHRDGVTEGRLPLLEGGTIVRLRIGGARDDLTVKLRPCTREQLVGRFSAPFQASPLTYKIERDWSAGSRVLAASLVHDHPPGALSSAVGPGAGPTLPIDPVRDQFLHACAPDVQVDALVALGPVLATRFDDVPLDDLEGNLEAWSVAGLEFLECSIRVKPKEDDDAEELVARAERKQRKLEDAVRARGVTPSEHSENKTKRVLTALAMAVQH
ncbi:hypothetical protein ABZZ79_07930 [Streptomyces sp. NPDC006458]|uniref:hypothetical protein n=1 Tax=Streptomyces sp. NPDC006458 TaxID=3154302 RepID=UPI0033BD1156